MFANYIAKHLPKFFIVNKGYSQAENFHALKEYPISFITIHKRGVRASSVSYEDEQVLLPLHTK